MLLYFNYAYSGFSTSMVLNGGTDACGNVQSEAPLQEAETTLGESVVSERSGDISGH